MPNGIGGWVKISALSLATTLAFASPASAATPLGQTTPGSPGGCAGNMDNVQVSVNSGTSYEAPSPGVITSWSQRSNSNPAASGRLQVWRRAGGTNYTLVGRSDAMIFTPDALNTFPTRISVEAGDLLGFRVGATATGCQFPGGAGLGSLASGPAGSTDPAPGETRPLSTAPGLLNVAAVLEPDADRDGYGDESQDCAPADPARAIDCAPPDTAISHGPKDKTRKKTATFEFFGGDGRAVAGFECSLDGAAFAACASPYTVKVKKGKHTFSARATDTAGNADTTPATDSWKVRGKRKRR